MSGSEDNKPPAHTASAPVRLVIENSEPAPPPPPEADPVRHGGNVVDFMPPEFSEEALSLFFSEAQRIGMRHVEKWGCWMIWTGQVWRRDDDNVALDRARHVCRTMADRCTNKRTATDIASKKTAVNILYLARADRRQAAVVEQWDVDEWLLNTSAGVVQLRKEGD